MSHCWQSRQGYVINISITLRVIVEVVSLVHFESYYVRIDQSSSLVYILRVDRLDRRRSLRERSHAAALV